jgi:hypothetical protein
LSLDRFPVNLYIVKIFNAGPRRRQEKSLHCQHIVS